MENVEKCRILALAEELYASVPGNIITPENAIDPSLVGLRLFDAPSVAFGSADDPLFEAFKDPKAVGPWHMSPKEWLPQAKTVVSLFFPFTEEIRASNRMQIADPSPQWLHGRIEGQTWLGRFMKALREKLEEQGFKACVPQQDPRWASVAKGKGLTEYGDLPETTFGSRWSERHAAYVCGLGTFGLSRGLITKRGIAGRFGSLVTDLDVPPTPREYSGLYDWCTCCGACARRCPANAITLEAGKDHIPCHTLLEESKIRFAPRYGCGLCQTAVPCETSAPGLKK